MAYTLLKITQQILSSLDSDEVNSIGDTVESLQVVQCIRQSFDDIMSRANLPEMFTLFKLDATSPDTPTVMKLPVDIAKLLWVKYDKTNFGEYPYPYVREVQYLEPDEFLRRTMFLGELDDQPYTQSFQFPMGGETFDFYCYNDRGPSFYTSLDDDTVIFDSYDVSQDACLQKSKTTCYGERLAQFVEEDSWVPPLDNQQFVLLINEAKALAFVELKQSQHPTAERKARLGWLNLQRQKQSIGESNYYRMPDYGRKGPRRHIPRILKSGW